LVVLSDAALTKEHRARTGQLDGDPDHGHQRPEQSQTTEGTHHVEHAAA